MQICKNLPEQEYHADPAIGSTTAKLMLDSPRLFMDAIEGIHTVEDKGHFQIGRLIHMMVLEPDRYKQCIVTEGPVNTKTGKPYGRDTNAFAVWQEQNPEKTVVEPWIHMAISRMPREVAELFEQDGESELSFFTEIHGTRVKCRADRFPKSGPYFYDLKTIAGGKGNIERAIDNEIKNRKYWFSGGWYRSVIKEVTQEWRTPRFVFAEKALPFRWIITDLDIGYMTLADAETDRVLHEIREREESGSWSDYDIHHTSEAPSYLIDEEED